VRRPRALVGCMMHDAPGATSPPRCTAVSYTRRSLKLVVGLIVAAAQRGELETQLPVLWHSLRKELCDALTKAGGACLRQKHPFSGDIPRPWE
jgi:hypothetical protein